VWDHLALLALLDLLVHLVLLVLRVQTVVLVLQADHQGLLGHSDHLAYLALLGDHLALLGRLACQGLLLYFHQVQLGQLFHQGDLRGLTTLVQLMGPLS